MNIVTTIDPQDICSLEPSDRTNFWELTLWHPTEERKVVIRQFHERDKQRAADLTATIAATVLAWLSDALATEGLTP